MIKAKRFLTLSLLFLGLYCHEYGDLPLEPFSIVTGKPDDLPSGRRWHIGIYIVFGRRVGNLEFLDPLSHDVVCDNRGCIRSIGICIQIDWRTTSFFDVFTETGFIENLGDFDEVESQQFLRAFPDMIERGHIEIAPFATMPSVNFNEIANSANQKTPLSLNGREDEPIGFIVENTMLLSRSPSGQVTHGDGSQIGEERRHFDLETSLGWIKRTRSPWDCFFHRQLARLLFCSKKWWNKWKCYYYIWLIVNKIPCGEEMNLTTRRPIWEIIWKVWKLIKWILDHIPNP